MLRLALIAALGASCTRSSPPAEEAPPPATEAPAPPAEAAAPAVRSASSSPTEGWGAILVSGDAWVRTRPGAQGVGAGGVVTLRPTGSQGLCGEVVEDPQGAMIVLPDGAHPGPIAEAPAVQAALVERSAWRLDELLPPLDLFSPAPLSAEPAKARGVQVGSVAKVRRHLAPPVLVVAGHRDCTGIVALLSADAGRALVQHQLDQACDPLRILPPSDLDGDGQAEVVAWSRSRVALYRFVEGKGDPDLVHLADWTCR